MLQLLFFSFFALWGLLPCSQINTQRLTLSYECVALAWLVSCPLLKIILSFCLWDFTFLYSTCISLLLAPLLIVWLCSSPLEPSSFSFVIPPCHSISLSLYSFCLKAPFIPLLPSYWLFNSLLYQTQLYRVKQIQQKRMHTSLNHWTNIMHKQMQHTLS